jgi:hypothetical protein
MVKKPPKEYIISSDIILKKFQPHRNSCHSMESRTLRAVMDGHYFIFQLTTWKGKYQSMDNRTIGKRPHGKLRERKVKTLTIGKERGNSY